MKKILVVDDEIAVANQFANYLTNEGFETVIALNGNDALQKVNEFTPDLILLDIMMPEMDGITVLKNLKSNPATSLIPVIIITNMDEKEDIVKATKLGALLYFIKVKTSLKILSSWIYQILETPKIQS